MTIFKFIILVLPIPLASHHLSTILSRFALLVFLFSTLFPEILGGLFQPTEFYQIHNILLSFIPSFQDSLLAAPVIVYSNADTEKLKILSDNKGLPRRGGPAPKGGRSGWNLHVYS